MSRHLDPTARFDLLREAAFRLVRRHGVHAVTRRALALEMGVDEATVRRPLRSDAPLLTLAATEVVNHRRRAAPWGTREPGADRARRRLAALLPGTPARLDDEIVWLRLRLAALDVVSALDSPRDFRSRVEVTRQGWAEPASLDDTPTGGAMPGLDDLATMLHDDDDARRSLAAVSPRDLGCDDGGACVSLLLTLLDGLTLAAATGRLTPQAMTEELEHWLDLLPAGAIHDGG